MGSSERMEDESMRHLNVKNDLNKLYCAVEEFEKKMRRK